MSNQGRLWTGTGPPPVWYRPPREIPSMSTVDWLYRCKPCGVTWRGEPVCWACGSPGSVPFE